MSEKTIERVDEVQDLHRKMACLTSRNNANKDRQYKIREPRTGSNILDNIGHSLSVRESAILEIGPIESLNEFLIKSCSPKLENS